MRREREAGPRRWKIQQTDKGGSGPSSKSGVTGVQIEAVSPEAFLGGIEDLEERGDVSGILAGMQAP